MIIWTSPRHCVTIHSMTGLMMGKIIKKSLEKQLEMTDYNFCSILCNNKFCLFVIVIRTIQEFFTYIMWNHHAAVGAASEIVLSSCLKFSFVLILCSFFTWNVTYPISCLWCKTKTFEMTAKFVNYQHTDNFSPFSSICQETLTLFMPSTQTNMQ